MMIHFCVLCSKQCLPQIQNQQLVCFIYLFAYFILDIQFPVQLTSWKGAFGWSLASACCVFHRESSRCGLPSWPHNFDSGDGLARCFLAGGQRIFWLQKVPTPHTYVWQSPVLWEWPDPTGCGRHQQTDRECGSRKPWAHYNLVIPTSVFYWNIVDTVGCIKTRHSIFIMRCIFIYLTIYQQMYLWLNVCHCCMCVNSSDVTYMFI